MPAVVLPQTHLPGAMRRLPVLPAFHPPIVPASAYRFQREQITMKLKMIALAAAALAASATANASVTLNVSGKVTPPSCTMNLAESNLSLGNIASATLNADRPTALDSKSTSIEVTCGADTKFALIAGDDRSGTVAADAVSTAHSAATAEQAYGLGAVAGTNTGAFVIALSNGLAGDTQTGFINSQDGQEWSSTTLLAPSMITAWQGQDGNSAATARSANATLTVNAAVIGTNELDLSREIDLAGKATIELHYL